MAAFRFTPLTGTAIGLGLGAVVRASLYTVDAGQTAVVYDRYRGVISDDIFGEGTHFIIPCLQKPHIFDVRARPHSISSVSGTKDLHMVNLTLRVLSRPDVTKLPTIFETLGLDYAEKVLPSIGNEALNAVVAQFKAEQLLTESATVSKLVKEYLISRAKDFGIELDDVAITHLSYRPEFSKAVEAKMVAQQEAERSEFVDTRDKLEARATAIRAEGEMESNKLVSEATQAAGKGFMEFKRIEAGREMAKTLAKKWGKNSEKVS